MSMLSVGRGVRRLGVAGAELSPLCLVHQIANLFVCQAIEEHDQSRAQPLAQLARGCGSTVLDSRDKHVPFTISPCAPCSMRVHVRRGGVARGELSERATSAQLGVFLHQSQGLRVGRGSVAVAELRGHRCEGCHLDLSAAEVDTAKEEAAESGFTDCPQCGRMLVV